MGHGAGRGTNPCREIVKYRARKRERFLTDGEFRRLGRVLGEAVSEGKVSVHAAAAIRLLMLTGCRCNEVLTLQWQDVDLEANEMRLRDSKTGPRAVPLSPPAVKVLADLLRVPGNPWVIAGRVRGAHMRNLSGPWGIVRSAGRSERRPYPRPQPFLCRTTLSSSSINCRKRLQIRFFYFPISSARFRQFPIRVQAVSGLESMRVVTSPSETMIRRLTGLHQ